MTRYEKIAISLPSRAAERVRRAVRDGVAPSASAYITTAIQRRLTREEGIAMIDGWLEESGGPMTEAERRMVDRELNTPVPYGPAATRKRATRSKSRAKSARRKKPRGKARR